MSEFQIAVIVGSLRKASTNRRLAQAIAKQGASKAQFSIVEIGDLPLYNEEADGHEVEAVRQFRIAVGIADAVLFVTPEYNRSIPGVLKNALDQGSRPYGQSVWSGKPAAVIGMSPGAPGTAMAQQHLRNVLAYLNMPTLGQPEMFLQMNESFFDADGRVGPRSHAFVQSFIDQFIAWIARNKA